MQIGGGGVNMEGEGQIVFTLIGRRYSGSNICRWELFNWGRGRGCLWGKSRNSLTWDFLDPIQNCVTARSMLWEAFCFKSFHFKISNKINSPGSSTGQVCNAPGLFHISLPKSRDTYIATRGVSKSCVMYLQQVSSCGDKEFLKRITKKYSLDAL